MIISLPGFGKVLWFGADPASIASVEREARNSLGVRLSF